MMKALLRSHDGAFGPIAAIIAAPLALLITLALDHADLSPRKTAIEQAVDQATALAASTGAGSRETLGWLIRRSLDGDLGPDLSSRVTVEAIEADGAGGLKVQFSAALPSLFARLFCCETVRMRITSHAVEDAPGPAVARVAQIHPKDHERLLYPMFSPLR